MSVFVDSDNVSIMHYDGAIYAALSESALHPNALPHCVLKETIVALLPRPSSIMIMRCLS